MKEEKKEEKKEEEQKSNEEGPWAQNGQLVARGGRDAPWRALTLEDGKLFLYGVEDGNKKVPPHTLLTLIRKGRLGHQHPEAAKGAGLKYLFTCPKKDQVYLFTTPTASLIGPKTLHDLILEYKITSIMGHGKIGAEVPKALTCQQVLYFNAEDDSAQALLNIENAASHTQFALRWVLKIKDGGLVPWGVAVVIAKMVIVKKGESVQLI